MNTLIVNLLGFTAGFFSTAAGIPQVIKTWRTRSTRDLSLLTVLMGWTGCLLWLIYAFCIGSLPMLAANGVGFFVLSLILAFKLKYK